MLVIWLCARSLLSVDRVSTGLLEGGLWALTTGPRDAHGSSSRLEVKHFSPWIFLRQGFKRPCTTLDTQQTAETHVKIHAPEQEMVFRVRVQQPK